jgi:tetratricopeptide (TPR) repeat protein
MYYSMLVTARLMQHLVPDRQLRRRESKTTDLRSELSKALQSGRFAEALALYKLIEKRKPDEPRWSHRKGDLLRRMGRDADAVSAYERAMRLYSAKGFDARAVATAKLLLAIDPSKVEVLEWVESQAARRFERQSRNAFQLTY